MSGISSADRAGTVAHDPLCVCSRKDHAHFYYTIPAGLCMTCKCDDIAAIRADEREQAALRVAALASWPDPESSLDTDRVCRYLSAVAAAQGEA